MDSLDRLLAVVENERAQQIRHFDAIDAKAGVVLGFAGALVALTPDVALAFLIPGGVLAVASAMAGVKAFWPQQIAGRINPRHLRERYLMAEERFTALRLLDTQIVMVEMVDRDLRKKTRWLKVAMTLLVAAIVVLGFGILASGEGATHVRPGPTGTPAATPSAEATGVPTGP